MSAPYSNLQLLFIDSFPAIPVRRYPHFLPTDDIPHLFTDNQNGEKRPEEITDVSVEVELDGELTCTYPAYNDGWNVVAKPDGTVIDKNTGLEYSYLFWEGTSNVEYDMKKGFVVAGEETAEFLQKVLAQMGLTPKEYNEFIVYWLPQMEQNPYNLITFQQEVYREYAKLHINPEPDSILRIFMAYKPLTKAIEIEEPSLESFERTGFCVVEWGGCQVK
jgi:hypothetical protein